MARIVGAGYNDGGAGRFVERAAPSSGLGASPSVTRNDRRDALFLLAALAHALLTLLGQAGRDLGLERWLGATKPGGISLFRQGRMLYEGLRFHMQHAALTIHLGDRTMRFAFLGLCLAALLATTQAGHAQDLSFLRPVMDKAVNMAESNFGKRYEIVYVDVSSLVSAAAESGIMLSAEAVIQSVAGRREGRTVVAVDSKEDVVMRGPPSSPGFVAATSHISLSEDVLERDSVRWIRDGGLVLCFRELEQTADGYTLRGVATVTFPIFQTLHGRHFAIPVVRQDDGWVTVRPVGSRRGARVF